MNWTALRAYLIARGQEASTWRGAVLLATGLGVHIAPELQEAIVTVGLIAAGCIGAVLPDGKPK